MPKNRELTTTERLTLDAWKKHETEFGAPPTYRQLAAARKVSVNAVYETVQRLRDKGWIAPKRITVTRLGTTAKARRAG